MRLDKVLLCVVVFLSTLICLCIVFPKYKPTQYNPYRPYPPQQWQFVPPSPETPSISTVIPGHLSYREMIAQIQQWEQEAPDLVEVGTYGKSTRGTNLYYIRLTNERLDNPNQKVVLITASLHGNEPWSTSVILAYIGTLLSRYGQDQEINELVDTRQIYFVPIVSPDSFPHSRYVDGVDPNRNFPGPRNPDRKSVPPVAALQNLFNQIKPNAVISGHTYGRVYLHPYGDRTERCPFHNDFERITGEMGWLSRYRVQRACQMYNRPIYGTEVDWYYRNGAFSLVVEFGSHQHIPSMQDTKSEFERTFKAIIHFIHEAPEVKIRTYGIMLNQAA